MAKLEELTIEIHAKDSLMHNIFKEIANKLYNETGVMVEHISFNWYDPGVIDSNARACHLLKVNVDSTKR